MDTRYLPLKVHESSEDGLNSDFYIRTNGGGYIGQCQRKEYAALIVRAVNSHDALVKAVQAMLAYGDSKFASNKEVAVQMALEAIAKAEGQI